MNRRGSLFTLIIMLGFGLSLNAQSIERHVFGTFGNHSTVGSTEICFTAGEPLTYTMTSIDFMATQGFHQPVISADDKIEVFFPNTFNPYSVNGVNTTFHPVYAERVTDYYMVIYSRWRQKVYESNSLEALDEGWDGTLNGEPVPEGVYVYKARFTINNFGELETLEANGVIHVVR